MAEAAFWGLLTAGSLLLGAGIALALRPGHRAVGLTMAFGAGALIAALYVWGGYHRVRRVFPRRRRGET